MKIIITFLTLVLIAQTGFAEDWEIINFPSEENLTGMYFVNTDTGFVTTHRGKVGITYNGGEEWFITDVTGGVPLEDIFFYNSDRGLVCGHQGSIYRTNDGANSWRIAASSGAKVKYIDLEMIDTKNGFVVGMEPKQDNPYSGVLKRTKNGGTTWETMETVGMGAFEMFTRPGLPLYLITFGMVHYSYDNGQNWTPVRTNHQAPGRTLCMFDHAGIVAGPTGMCAFTVDSGKTWNVTPQAMDRYFVASEMLDDQTAYIGGAENCLMKTVDGGISWTDIDIPKPFDILDFALTEDRLYACGSKGGMIVLKLTKD